jgi:hypothetical protein
MKCGRDLGLIWSLPATVLLLARTVALCPDCRLAFERLADADPLVTELATKRAIADKHFSISRDASDEQMEAWIADAQQANNDLAAFVDRWLAEAVSA